MGLTSWRGTKVRQTDVTVAKNYLNAAEIAELNRVVVMYLDYAEDQARRHRPLYMRDWRAKLDAFLRFNERQVPESPGKVSMEVARALAVEEYEWFTQRRLAEEAARADEEFDEVMKKFLPHGGKGKKKK
jgi:hypothetical protein